ncbi:MAG: D-alanyl-D-alanine carboxypeptidase family protein [Bacillota bacterium]
MKQILITLLILTLSAGLCLFEPCYALDTSAKAAIIMDVNTDRVLYSKNIQMKLPMASTTKIMTTLVAIESGKLDDKVKVSRRASNTEGSSIYLKEGEQLTIEELLYGVMLRSGNDAAVAVAEYVGGTEAKFVEMMNMKAKEIGAVNTCFANPHGLDHKNHYTTAYDLALITSYALKNPKFKEIVSTRRKTIEGPPGVNWDRALLNKNKMLWEYEGGDGVKTGYTKKAGRCLVSSATKDNWQLVCVVLNCGPMWNESSALLDYAFTSYENTKVVDAENTIQKVEVKRGKKKAASVIPVNDFSIPLKEEEKSKVKIIPEYNSNNTAPISSGVVAGQLKVYLDEKLIGRVELKYAENIESSDPIYYINRILEQVLSTN